ncbi:MAG: hypothetical protein V4701_00065 [Pseudomonadota bacterium]
MNSAPAGSQLVLLSTDPMARIDVPFLIGELGARLLCVTEADGVLTFSVETRAAPTD